MYVLAAEVPTVYPQPTPDPFLHQVTDPSSSFEPLSGQLKRICKCESGGTHYDKNGDVLRGRVDPDDIGICQINLRYHQATAESLGLDVFKYQDNITYAWIEYRKNGTQPWVKSQFCWNK